ncbi:amidase [Puerhibacterium puerhi]|uniref:amidase n=1 Tax=Puerhibacterium puerhi TaxID=2692623 RepID=UPI0019163D7D|nr:amidase [Puerhibacterium puerhi]
MTQTTEPTDGLTAGPAGAAPTAPNALDATAVAAAVRAGTLTVREVAEAVLARYAARDGDVRAWAHLDPAQVLAAADTLDAAPVKGPLHGVPVGVKDVIATKDMPTEHATARYAGSRPGVDAACVDVLRAAGALLVGKTTTTEFAATSVGGPTRNPHDPGRTPGGSSSGSGAAVADLQCAVALGTQTGGSTIRPGSFNGVYAWKPTWNSISREGLKMYSATCDTVGLYARSARDLELLAGLFRIEPAPAPATLAGARVGVCRTPEWRSAGPATRDALAAAADALRDAGAEVVDLALPDWFDGLYPAHRAILRREGRSAFLNEYLTTPDLPPFFRDVVEGRAGVDMNGRPAPDLTVDDYRAAYALADRARAAFDEIAAGFDVVLTPSTTGEAPEGLESTGSSVFNSMWTLLQVPVVNVPGLVGPAGMPVGVSLVARRYDDRRAIGFAGLLGERLAAAAGERAAAVPA